MSTDQEIELYICRALANDYVDGIRLRVRKLQKQMQRYGFDLLDIHYVLRHRESCEIMKGDGERYKVVGCDVDGNELTVIVTKVLEDNLKVVNAWRENQ